MGPIFEETNPVTKHVISLTQRVDRHLLLEISEQSRSIGFLRVNLFGQVENEHRQLPLGDPVLQRAIDVFLPIAKMFASNTYTTKKELVSARNAALSVLGINRSQPARPDVAKSVISKKPAAAPVRVDRTASAFKPVEPVTNCLANSSVANPSATITLASATLPNLDFEMPHVPYAFSSSAFL
jgi:hypothetical protein